MNNDLISRSYLKQMLPAPIEDEYKYVHKIIDNAPTVTPDMAQVLAYECGKASAERPTGKWIEVKTRPCTDEEFEEYKRLFGDDIDRNEFPYFICPMPSDGDEILICTSWGVDKDKCEYDPDYGYGLEERGDWEDVIAWMPLPAPYKKEADNE